MANRHETQEMLDLTSMMWDDPLVYFYQSSQLAESGIDSIFLAGPTSREDVLEFKWRAFAVHYLRKAGGHICFRAEVKRLGLQEYF
jgi:hypothetical protein